LTFSSGSGIVLGKAGGWRPPAVYVATALTKKRSVYYYFSLDEFSESGYNHICKVEIKDSKMTVAELIAKLQTLPQDYEVEMGMNQEYQEAVTEDMVVIEEYRGRRYVIIDDCARYRGE
jgi:hypothetical protein